MIEKTKKIFKHPLFKNSLFNSGGFVFVSLIGLIITPLLVHYFGLEPYGVYVLVTGIFGYYGILDFGLGQALIKFVAQYKAQNDIKALNDAVNSVLWFQFLVGGMLSLAIFLFAKKIIYFFNVSPGYFHETVIALKIATIGFFFSMLASSFAAAIKGLERYDIASIIDSISYIGINIFLLLIVLNGFGIQEAILVNVSVAILQLFIQIYAFKKLNKSFQIKLVFKCSIIKAFLSFSTYLFVSRITGIIKTHGVKLIISFFLNPTAVTIFVVPSKLINAVSGILFNSSVTLFPYVSKLHTLRKHAQIKNMFIKANKAFTYISIPLLLFITFFSKPILTLWMGNEFSEKSWMILSVLAFSNFFSTLTMVPTHTILGFGLTKLILLFTTFDLFLYATLLPILTYKFGVMGTAAAMCIVSALDISLVLLKTVNAIGLQFKDYLSKIFRHHLIPITLYSFCGYLVIVVFNLKTLFSLLTGIIMLSTYYIYFFKNFFDSITKPAEI